MSNNAQLDRNLWRIHSPFQNCVPTCAAHTDSAMSAYKRERSIKMCMTARILNQTKRIQHPIWKSPRSHQTGKPLRPLHLTNHLCWNSIHFRLTHCKTVVAWCSHETSSASNRVSAIPSKNTLQRPSTWPPWQILHHLVRCLELSLSFYLSSIVHILYIISKTCI